MDLGCVSKGVEGERRSRNKGRSREKELENREMQSKRKGMRSLTIRGKRKKVDEVSVRGG